MGALLVGAFVAFVIGQSLRAGGREGPAAAGERAQCSVTLIFLAPDDAVGELVDAVTGRTGAAHVVVDACETDAQGVALVYDCQPLEGMSRKPRAVFEGRDSVSIAIDGQAAWHLRGWLAARVGAPYTVGTTCAAVIASGLRGYQGPQNPTPGELLTALQGPG